MDTLKPLDKPATKWSSFKKQLKQGELSVSVVFKGLES